MFILCSIGRAQNSWKLVYFKDKKGTAFQISNPSGYLSTRALARRVKAKITIDSTDLPVSEIYADSIARIPQITVSHRSKWLNAVLIRTTDANALQQINNCSFVKQTTDLALRGSRRRSRLMSEEERVPAAVTAFFRVQQQKTDLLNYGPAAPQSQLHNGNFLHNLGLQGQNMIIAFFDSGFRGYLNNPFYDSARQSGRILGVYDLVAGDGEVNSDDGHGNNVFSIVAANKPGLFVGTAPSAQYYLFRTEDVGSEQPIEEFNWLVAAEKADSLGVDIISSSLGYSTFDQAVFDYSYVQMNGRTAMVTRAAETAFSKGMMVVNSAGNEGGNSWKYIVAPADGPNVLAVGAVTPSGNYASFSSTGPSADGRVKPDVMATGAPTTLVSSNGNVVIGGGTSYACPVITGLTACLWQAFPEATHLEVLEAIRKSAGMYTSPDFRMGYGIPNFRKAYDFLLAGRILKDDTWIKIYPNPAGASTNITFKGQTDGTVAFRLLQLNGSIVSELQMQTKKHEIYTQELNLPAAPGIYLLHYNDGQKQMTLRIMKQ